MGAEPIMRRVELPETIRGHLFLHSMPGRYEPFEEFLTDIVLKNISCVVCLSSPEEIRQGSSAYATLLAGTVPWEHITFPMWNSVMRDAPALEPLTQEIVKRLREGRNVLIQCDSGISRAGAVALAVLLSFWPLSHNPEASTTFERPNLYARLRSHFRLPRFRSAKETPSKTISWILTRSSKAALLKPS